MSWCIIVKELAKYKISSLEEANQLVQRRKLIHNCYIHVDKKLYKLQHCGNDCRLEINSFIDVYTFLDGTYHFYYKDIWYDLMPFEKKVQQQPKHI